MERKRFVVIALFSAVLLPVAFAPLSGQQGNNSYDPWLDFNEDGKIDATDLYPLGQSYGTLGNPTKNVNVTGYANTEGHQEHSLTEYETYIFYIENTKGYREISLGIHCNPSIYTVNVTVQWAVGNGAYDTYYTADEFQVSYQGEFADPGVLKQYSVQGHALRIRVFNLQGPSAIVVVNYYMTA